MLLYTLLTNLFEEVILFILLTAYFYNTYFIIMTAFAFIIKKTGIISHGLFFNFEVTKSSLLSPTTLLYKLIAALASFLSRHGQF